ncbi:MAG: hypothetical protein ABH850_06090 [Candidatus Micrarchaeota archaeon]
MKKIIFILFFLLFLTQGVFAYPSCDPVNGHNTVFVTINLPSDGYTRLVGQTFTYQLQVRSADIFSAGPCTTDLEFRYDEKTDGASYVRIKDSVFDPGPDFFEESTGLALTNQTVNLEDIDGGTADVEIKCNSPGTYKLKGYSTALGGIDSSNIINVICNAPPNSPPTGNFTSPALGDVIAVYGNSYRLEWDVPPDPEGDPVDFDVDSNVAGNLATNITEKYFDVSGLLPDIHYFFTVTIDDHISTPLAIKSGTLIGKKLNNTLSISDLYITPDVIYGNESIDVNLTVRNNSPDPVDINVFFYNDEFDSNPVQKAIPFLAPYSKASFSMHEDFSGSPILAGDYNVTVRIKESVIGDSSIRTDTKYYVYFTVLAENRSISAPETNFFVVILIALSVVLIARKKH